MKLDSIDIDIEKTERRKTVSIFIERNGSVKVLAPALLQVMRKLKLL
jgi:hypothetical protein